MKFIKKLKIGLLTLILSTAIANASGLTADPGSDFTIGVTPSNPNVTLDGSASTPSATSSIINYEWFYAGNSLGTGVTLTVTPPASGVYTVTLTVTDAEGNSASDTVVVTVVVGNYTRDDTHEVVTDNATGLMWQDDEKTKTIFKRWVTQANYDAGNYNDTSGDTATSYCSNLTLGGYTDWRLPTQTELEGIVDSNRTSPSLDVTFVNSASGRYWSSTTVDYNHKLARGVYFNNGSSGKSLKRYKSFVRCVRAGQ